MKRRKGRFGKENPKKDSNEDEIFTNRFTVRFFVGDKDPPFCDWITDRSTFVKRFHRESYLRTVITNVWKELSQKGSSVKLEGVKMSEVNESGRNVYGVRLPDKMDGTDQTDDAWKINQKDLEWLCHALSGKYKETAKAVDPVRQVKLICILSYLDVSWMN